MKRLQILQKLVYEKFYVHEIAALNSSKIYFLKNVKKTYEPNKPDLNHNWTRSVGNYDFFWIRHVAVYLFITLKKVVFLVKSS